MCSKCVCLVAMWCDDVGTPHQISGVGGCVCVCLCGGGCVSAQTTLLSLRHTPLLT